MGEALRTLRILHDPACDGPTNMARDEALLTLVGEGRSGPTLRTYLWSPPTISLGYFQKYADYERLPPPGGGLPVVRRQTGGGAILHDGELTYSITVPLDHPLIAEHPNRLYELAHDAIIECFRNRGIETRRGVETRRGEETEDSGPARGPFFCFARRHRLDVLLGHDKLAGSAQRRTRRAVLQHGSIMFARRFEQQPMAVLPVSAALGPEEFRRLFADTFTRRTGLTPVRGDWTPDELAQAAERVAKYARPEWTRRG